MAININPANKGKLHRKLGVPEGEPIPAKKLRQATNSKSPELRREANFAENAKGFKHPSKLETSAKATEDRAEERGMRRGGGKSALKGAHGFEDSGLRQYDHGDYRHTSEDR